VEQTLVPFARPRTLQMTYEPKFIEVMQRARMQIDEGRKGHTPQ
jgi:hypothetical protein